MAVPGKEEVARGDNAEVDRTGLAWIPDSFGYSYVIVDRCGQTRRFSMSGPAFMKEY